MIGDRFIRYLKATPPRNMPRMNLFLSFLALKIKEGQNRAAFSVISTNGVRLLTEILNLVDLDSLLSTSDFRRKQGEYILSLLSEIEKPIDIKTGSHTTQSLFMKTKKPCFEIISASRRKNPLMDIPFNSRYESDEWKQIKPFRIVDMGTADLTFRVYDAKLDYYGSGPTHAIYTLDCFAFICKFIAYYKSKQKVDDLNSLIRDYIHYEIVIPTLLRDSVSLWLRNLYRIQFTIESRLESLTPTFWDNVDIDQLGTDFTGAMVDINHLKTDLTKENISNLTVLSTLPLTTDGMSFLEYYKDLFETTALSDQQPYIWIDCLKNMEWWNFILLTASFVPNFPDAVSFQRDLSRDVRFWVMMRPWQNIHQSFPYRAEIKSKLESMYQYLNHI